MSRSRGETSLPDLGIPPSLLDRLSAQEDLVRGTERGRGGGEGAGRRGH